MPASELGILCRHACINTCPAFSIVAINDEQTNLKVGDSQSWHSCLHASADDPKTDVGIKWIADSCNRCEFCRQGYEPLCKKAQCSGFSVDGSFQQFAVSYTSQLSLIPDGLSLQDAAPIL